MKKEIFSVFLIQSNLAAASFSGLENEAHVAFIAWKRKNGNRMQKQLCSRAKKFFHYLTAATAISWRCSLENTARQKNGKRKKNKCMNERLRIP